MTDVRTRAMIDALAADVRPVEALPPPRRRAWTTLAAMALIGAVVVAAMSDMRRFLELNAGREALLAAEMFAMLATGVLAVTGAFFLSVPGRSRRWLAAPAPFFAAWLMLGGAGCYADFVRGRAFDWSLGQSMHCLLFILGVSAVLAPPLLWRLSRAAPIDPLPVALLGGLGIAALSAFLLHFFHPFSVTAVDLGVHALAVLAVTGVAGLLNRRTLAPA